MRIHLFASVFILTMITTTLSSRAVQVITSDTTWSGTVNLTEDVIVSNNAVLTVSPGTVVIAAATDAGPAPEGVDPNRIELRVMEGTLRAQSAVFRGESSVPACWHGITYQTNSMGSISNCVISNAFWAIIIEHCAPDQVAIIDNLICNLSGPTGVAYNITGNSVIGIVVHGAVGQIVVSNNVIRDLQGGSGWDGTNGLSGEDGESGITGGGAVGITVSVEANAIVIHNTISNLTASAGGTGGRGGDGIAGSNAPDFYTPAESGAAGGSGGHGGDGGGVTGILIYEASPTIIDNTIIDLQAGNGGPGNNGGSGGQGGSGYNGSDATLDGAAGGNGGIGGEGGFTGQGGGAHGIFVDADCEPNLSGNTIKNLRAGHSSQAGEGGGGGMGGTGGQGGAASGSTRGGNGGHGGNGALGGMAKSGSRGGQATGIFLYHCASVLVKRHTIQNIISGNGGRGGNGGPGGYGGPGGDGGLAATGYTSGNGGNGGNGNLGGIGGDAGQSGIAAGIYAEDLTRLTDIANNDISEIYQAYPGPAGFSGRGGDGSTGGSGAGGNVPGNGGNGGNGGDGRYGPSGASANYTALILIQGCSPYIIHNTAVYSYSFAPGTPASSDTLGGEGGNPGVGGDGFSFGTFGQPGTNTVGTPGVSGTLGIATGLFVTNGAPIVFNNIFQGSELSNSVAIFADDTSWSGMSARCNYNNLWLWGTNYAGLIPSHAYDISVDPGFTSATDHHLTNNSLCIDAIPWFSEGFQAQDHDGVNRPLDGNNSSVADPDMGAYEYASALADTDGDTLKDAAELYAGTDPANNTSFLCIASVERQGTTNLISWVSAPNRIYSVQCNSDLLTTNWTDVSLSESATVPTNIFAAPMTGTETSLFYRIVVP